MKRVVAGNSAFTVLDSEGYGPRGAGQGDGQSVVGASLIRGEHEGDEKD